MSRRLRAWSRAFSHDGADASAGAALPPRAGDAVGGVRSVGVDARGVVGAPIGELAPGWAHEQVALAIEGEVVAGQLALGLMLTLEHRHMRLDIPLHQPGQERAGAIVAVGCQVLWLQPQPVRLAATISCGPWPGIRPAGTETLRLYRLPFALRGVGAISSVMFDLSFEAAAGCDLVCGSTRWGAGRSGEAYRRTGAGSDQ